ncbi:MAG: 3-phosphoserine/phosphohydroxythreonine transaminase [Anaerovoracaceae bacterium]|nr:3-phosphoserine/phosphohydroxythreonine transaminase [Bacillota bacterium]MDY2670539.1 3-phosphoserine/phosphohydroxythreonine transaminase [Anaerovoracaceae bacterium]
MDRVYNFSAGPSTLPVEVLEEAAADMLNYKGCGMSVMEMSHRSQDFQNIIDAAESDLRDLMQIPDNYKVLFLQGGGTLQFSMVPINLLRNTKKADYIVTGNWANKAYQEAQKFGDVVAAASSEDKNFTYVPKVGKDAFRPDADYVYITTNNTIYGTRYNYIPDTGDILLAADQSSNFLSETYNVEDFGLIYAGAQKNVGPAGVTIVIVRDDLLGFAPENTPIYLDYNTHAKKGSMYNTPPCYAIYMAGLTFKWIKKQGGVKGIEQHNIEQAEKLYDAIDNSSLFSCPVVPEDRSRMNAVFVTGDKDLDARFVAEAKENGIVNIKGHRSVGGLRASIYNAMPDEGIDALISFMKKFEMENK